MSERYLLMTLGRLPKEPVETVVNTLATIWIRTLYTPAYVVHTHVTRPPPRFGGATSLGTA